jgi:hypothetical protein
MCCLAFEHESYAGSKKCSKAAKAAGNCIANNPLPVNKKITAPGKMDETSDSDVLPKISKKTN